MYSLLCRLKKIELKWKISIESFPFLIQSYTAQDEDVAHKDKVDDLMREICVECLCRQLECYNDLSHEEKFTKAMSYMKRYQDTLYLAQNLNATEPQYGDTLVS